ncbi:hypothetical protein EMPG_09411 [Blastomyces silverae]|uniref:Uncharacterized protein n=1 Tax=Blastomyces silverae TaxID=2060906 RepID=A0A0H1BP57_9EURO|nr:hypothetical protein EMPG_09411 [Blastomyces silverae]
MPMSTTTTLLMVNVLSKTSTTPLSRENPAGLCGPSVILPCARPARAMSLSRTWILLSITRLFTTPSPLSVTF